LTVRNIELEVLLQAAHQENAALRAELANRS
jgi:hypothetical protein